MNEALGIDFGTTNSATVGIDRHGRISQYGDGFGQPYPSVIAIDQWTGHVRARGREAWKEREQLKESCRIITSVKTQLGQNVSWIIGDRTWKPEHVASEILVGLKEEMAKRKKLDVREAFIAIPVGFSPAKRRSLRSAAKIAGIEVAGFVSEPTAAVYKHYDSVKKWERVAVFDWGGGTLDLAVVDLTHGAVQELATSGIQLGGNDIDRTIASWAHNQFLRTGASDASLDQMPGRARDDLMVESEAAKCDLSFREEASILLYEYGDFGDVTVTLRSETFARLVKPYLEQAILALRDTVKRVPMSLEALGCVLMVGGSSKLQGLYYMMEEEMPCQVIRGRPESSDWDIAEGAAMLHAAGGKYVVAQDLKLLLSDGTPYSLVQKGDVVDHLVQTSHFGLVEDSDTAQFVFIESADGRIEPSKDSRNHVGYLTCPAFGFTNEPIRLNYQIDDDLLFRAWAHSTNKTASHSRTWEYEKLRFVYELPGERNK